MRTILKKLGLSDKKIDLYIAGLKTGPATVQNLAKFSQIKRPTVYVLLEHLAKLGLANRSFKGEQKLFEMASPQKLFKFIDEEKREAEEKENFLQKVMPEFEAIVKKSEFATDTKIYEGFDLVKEIFGDLAKTKGITYTISSGHFYDKLDINWFIKNVTQVRERAKNKSFIISDPHPLVIKFYLMEETNIREFRFLPKDMIMPSVIQIHEDTVVMISMDEPYSCIVMKNRTIAETLKFLFNLIWQSLKEKNLPDAKVIEEARKIQLK
jgi:sugar-specific transcriptional regulator TrmB